MFRPMAAVTHQTVLSVKHYTDRLFAFRITRPASFRFRSGEFVMLGLEVDGKPLLRAYSIASPSWDEELEFFSIKVPDGPLTSRLQEIQPGDEILLATKSVGTLVLDALMPGRRLYLLSTGTGVAPFASIVRDPETYEKFETVVLTHTTREVAELEYSRELIERVRNDPLVGEAAAGRLIYYPSCTRETFERQGRITRLIDDGTLFSDIGCPPFDPAEDRVMICGSIEMIASCRTRVEGAGLSEGSNARPGEFVVEKSFVG
ncbi:ferredoxin--NADP reductase [Marinicauda pacifica]|uniref:ferredoxin--NADP(+) reductase n=2 Tax=Marinicauda pacifica TaxID=1133559 RepID=A0A4S2H8B4_9PROT|nr:ferredoxin--NADP reductase [Marinicauda pacifica]